MLSVSDQQILADSEFEKEAELTKETNGIFLEQRMFYAMYNFHFYNNIFLLAVMSVERCVAVMKSLRCQRYQFNVSTKKKWQTGRAVTRSSRVGGLSLRFKSRSFHVGNRVANDLRPCAATSFEGVLLPGGDTRKCTPLTPQSSHVSA